MEHMRDACVAGQPLRTLGQVAQARPEKCEFLSPWDSKIIPGVGITLRLRYGSEHITDVSMVVPLWSKLHL